MLKRIVVLSFICVISLRAMDSKGSPLTRAQLIEQLWIAKENQTSTPPLTRSLEDIGKEAMENRDHELFNSCAEHYSPRTLDKMSCECVRKIPTDTLKKGHAKELWYMVGKLTTLRQKPENQPDAYYKN